MNQQTELKITTGRGSWEGTLGDAGVVTGIDGRFLDEIFRLFNRVDEADVVRLDRIGYELPSLSVGDVIEIPGVGKWTVADIGFKREPVDG